MTLSSSSVRNPLEAARQDPRSSIGVADGTAPEPAAVAVVGRGAELSTIDDFLAGRGAHSLVLEGEAGIGKSTLWLAGIEMARERGYEVLPARPAAIEGSLSFLGLNDLLATVPPRARQQLPEVQRHALAVALAEEEMTSSPVESGVLGVAMLGLLRELAAVRPLLLAIDDLQWLDESSGAVLVYALRRATEARVHLLASCRATPEGTLPFALERALDERALVRVQLGPLSEGAIRRMLRLQIGLDLTRIQLHALYEVTAGNPFYSVELARAGIELDGSGSIRLPRKLRELAGVRLEALPAQTRDALGFVAALADPDERILDRIGLRGKLEPAFEAGVLDVDARHIRFVHPLVRAAAWEDVEPLRRRDVHRALSDAVDDLEQSALHLGAAAEPPDSDAADALEQAAANAHRRGAPAAAAAFLDRALELTAARDLDRWARLAASAAEAHADASHWDSVWDLVERAQERLPAGPERAAILVTAAEMKPGLEDLFRQAAIEAGGTAVGVWALIGLSQQATLAGRQAEGIDAARQAAKLARLQGDRGLLGIALTEFGAQKIVYSQLDGWHELREALAIEQDLGGLPARVFQSPRTWQAVEMTFGNDPHAARAIFEERVAADLGRGDEVSAFQSTPILVLAQLYSGDWASARETARATLDWVEGLGYEYARPILLFSVATVEAYQGNLIEARDIGTEALSTLTGFGDRFWTTFLLGSLVFAELCAGNASAALTHAAAIDERFPERECWWSYHQGNAVEALVLAGEHGRALARAATLRRSGDELSFPRFLAWADRGEGLVWAAEGDLLAAQNAFDSALSHHERFMQPLERARTQLVYGSVLRRLQRRRVARAVLGEALAEFERLGAGHFIRCAQEELSHVGGRPPVGEHELTAAEDRIARLVASGRSNKEVAAELFVTVSTVEAALTRVYRKLGLKSRLQLAHELGVPDDRTA